MKILGFDYETTSNQPGSTRAVQLGAVLHCPETKQQEVVINKLCNPGCDISDGAAEVHGITAEMVKDADPDTVVSRELAAYIEANRDKIILAGHNCGTFDRPILTRLGEIDLSNIPMIDTMVCAVRIFPNAENHKLGPLYEKHIGGSAEDAHDAVADIRMVLALVELFCAGLRKTPLELAQWCAEPRILTICHISKNHKGKPWGKGKGCVPFHFVRWMTENWTETTPDMIATIQHHYGLEFKYVKDARVAARKAARLAAEAEAQGRIEEIENASPFENA